MTEETFLACDGADCTAAARAEQAVEDGWWHGSFIQHSPEAPADTFEIDLCPACCTAMFPDEDEDPETP